MSGGGVEPDLESLRQVGYVTRLFPFREAHGNDWLKWLEYL